MLRVMGDREGVGDSVDDSDSGTLECPWMLEDLDGPMDDDIFVNKLADYWRKLRKEVKAFLKEKRQKKRTEQQQNSRGRD